MKWSQLMLGRGEKRKGPDWLQGLLPIRTKGDSFSVGTLCLDAWSELGWVGWRLLHSAKQGADGDMRSSPN